MKLANLIASVNVGPSSVPECNSNCTSQVEGDYIARKNSHPRGTTISKTSQEAETSM